MSRRTELIFLLIIDTIACLGAVVLFYHARFEWGLVDRPIQRPPSVLVPAVIFTVFWLTLFTFAGLYRSRFAASRFDEIISVFKIVTFGILVLFFLIFIDQLDARSGRLPIMVYWLSMVGLVILGRMILRTIQKALLLRGLGTHNTLLIGRESLLLEFTEELQKYPQAGFKLIGEVRVDEQECAMLYLQEKADWPINDPIAALPEIIARKNVQDVVLALGSQDHSVLNEVLRICDGLPVALKLVPDFYSVIGGMARTEHMYGLPLIEVYPEPMAAWEESTKRLIDFLFSLSGLLVLLPFMLLIAVFIKVTSSGAVIYRQKRVGQHGREFTMLKFRTMRVDAEAATGPVWASADDERYTPIGRWLRKLRLDELPQLWNVLLGQMSLVGPRPERPFFVEKLAREIPLYGRRHRVKPGITGLAQVKWKYDETVEDVRQKVKYDLFYIENMSLKQDISILFQTLRTAIMGKGQ
ncbi:MAG: sugar transferase [Bacteroidetes Order II. Incertae sedis bacterium]|nr:sugar transferase [Bacteroidetes Order II. bacterium]